MVWFRRRNSGRKKTRAKSSFNVHFPQSRVWDTFPSSNTGLQDGLHFLKLLKFGFAIYLRCTCNSYISHNIYMLTSISAIKYKNNHRKILIMLCLRLPYKSPSAMQYLSCETQRNIYYAQCSQWRFFVGLCWFYLSRKLKLRTSPVN